MESCVTVILTLAVEIQKLIEQNEDLANKTRSLKTALSPLAIFDSLPHGAQANIQGNVDILTSTMESLKMELQAIVKNGFTLQASKTIITIQKRENDLRNILKSLQINWDLISTLNLESKFNAMRLLSHNSAKRFWATHFGAEVKYIDWIDFQHTMKEVYCVKDYDELHSLEVTFSQDNKVSVYTFDSHTRSKGVPASFWHIIYSENKEKAKIALEQEHNVVDQLFEKLKSIIDSSAARIGTHASLFMKKLPGNIRQHVQDELPDFGIKRVLSLGTVSAKKLQNMASSIAKSETDSWLEALEAELKLCISQILFTLNAAHADGLGQRLLAPDVMEARMKKITTHLSQKGFVEQILGNAKKQATTMISQKISEIEAVTAEYTAASAVYPLNTLNAGQFGTTIQEIVEASITEILKLLFLVPVKRLLDSTLVDSSSTKV